jgi:predicted transcriptional regulator
MEHHPIRQDEYLNDSYFRPELSSHLAEYRKAVESLTTFENESLANVVAQLKAKDEEIRELKESVAKLQHSQTMMLDLMLRRSSLEPSESRKSTFLKQLRDDGLVAER